MSLDVRAWSSEFGVQTLELGIRKSELGVWTSELRVWKSELEVWKSEFRAQKFVAEIEIDIQSIVSYCCLSVAGFVAFLCFSVFGTCCQPTILCQNGSRWIATSSPLLVVFLFLLASIFLNVCVLMVVSILCRMVLLATKLCTKGFSCFWQY